MLALKARTTIPGLILFCNGLHIRLTQALIFYRLASAGINRHMLAILAFSFCIYLLFSVLNCRYYLFVCTCVVMFVLWSTMWRSEDNWVVNSLLPPCGSRNQSQVVRLGVRDLYTPNHLAGSNTWFFTWGLRIKLRFYLFIYFLCASVLCRGCLILWNWN